MINDVNFSFSASAPNAGGRIVDRLYPNSPHSFIRSTKFRPFREIFAETIGEEFPELKNTFNYRTYPSLKEQVNFEATGYFVTVPVSHMQRLQDPPAESKQSKLFSTFNFSDMQMTGSLVNMSV